MDDREAKAALEKKIKQVQSRKTRLLVVFFPVWLLGFFPFSKPGWDLWTLGYTLILIAISGWSYYKLDKHEKACRAYIKDNLLKKPLVSTPNSD